MEKLVWQFQVSILILLEATLAVSAKQREFGDERLEMAHRLAPGMLEVVEAPCLTLADEFLLKPVF